MGLLDDLKRQADTLRTQTSAKHAAREDNVRVVEEGMHRAFFYILELFKQLSVLQPVNPLVYSLQGIGDIRDLRYADSFIDARKKKIGDRDVYDYMDFWIKWSSPASLTVERDMPPAIAKVRDLLWGSNIKFTEEEVRNAQRSLVKVVFKIPAALSTDFTLRADHDNRKLLFYGKNVLRLGKDDFAVPADDFSEATVEELAKLVLGQPSEFSKRYRTVLPHT